MTGIDRRDVLRGTMATAAIAAFGAPAPIFAATARPAIFIFDGRSAQARDAALAFRRDGIPILDRMEIDLGHAWRSHIPAHLAGGGMIAGLTLWVDSYICETFGRELGLAMGREQGAPGTGLYKWSLR